jgi:hypothetical protein
MLLALAQLLDIAGNVDRFEGNQAIAARLAPVGEAADGQGVGFPGVLVADGGGEEFDEAVGGLLAGVGKEGGDDVEAGAGQRPRFGDRHQSVSHSSILLPRCQWGLRLRSAASSGVTHG